MFRAFESVEGHGALHDSSPISPYVSQHLGMRANASPDTPTTGNLRDKWGFNPGADDTLDVSHGGWGIITMTGFLALTTLGY